MTDPTPSALERQLALARAAYTPHSDLRVRVLDKLLSTPAILDTPPAFGAGDALPAARGRALHALPASGVKALVAVGLVALGFAAGWQAKVARDRVPPLTLPAPRAVEPEPILVPAPLPANPMDGTVRDPRVDEVRAAPAASPPQLRASDGWIAPRPRPGTPSRAPSRSAHSPEPQPPQPHPPSPPLASSSAREELALLQRAERAVRAGNAALGLALIAELEAEYPRSKLLEERRAVELMAHCAAGASDSRPRAERFLREQPRSIYAGRIQELCNASATPSRR